MNEKVLKFVGSIGLCLLSGIIGSIFTVSAIPTWYATLNKPFFSPPNWLFGPVWTLLYILMGISLFLVWTGKGNQKKKSEAIRMFFIQLTLNFLWSLGFFGLKSPILGFVIILGMIISIVLTMKLFYPLQKKATYLLIPYIAWVSFATILNGAIFVLN